MRTNPARAAIPNGVYSTLLNGGSCKNDNGWPVRPGELPGNEVRSVVVLQSAPLPNAGAHLLERIPLWTMSTRIYVAPLAHVTVRLPLDCGHRTPVISPRAEGEAFRNRLDIFGERARENTPCPPCEIQKTHVCTLNNARLTTLWIIYHLLGGFFFY